MNIEFLETLDIVNGDKRGHKSKVYPVTGGPLSENSKHEIEVEHNTLIDNFNGELKRFSPSRNGARMQGDISSEFFHSPKSKLQSKMSTLECANVEELIEDINLNKTNQKYVDTTKVSNRFNERSSHIKKRSRLGTILNANESNQAGKS